MSLSVIGSIGDGNSTHCKSVKVRIGREHGVAPVGDGHGPATKSAAGSFAAAAPGSRSEKRIGEKKNEFICVLPGTRERTGIYPAAQGEARGSCYPARRSRLSRNISDG